MADFSELYVIGSQGGFMGADGVNPIEFLVLVGDASRQWLEPHYFDKSINPIGKLRSIIPAGPDQPEILCWMPASHSALGILQLVSRSGRSNGRFEMQSVSTLTLILKMFPRRGPDCARRCDRYSPRCTSGEPIWCRWLRR